VNARDGDGKTPLDYARAQNREEMVELLSESQRSTRHVTE
jgi:hypothetical protein